MKVVEYRLLQYVLSHVSDDRVTVALVYWDGETLRHASSERPTVLCPEEQRDALRATIRAFMRTAGKIERGRDTTDGELYGLEQLFPVRSGMGAALFWSPVVTVKTSNPLQHFQQLRSALRLDDAPEESKHATVPALRKLVRELGRTIQPKAPERVFVDHPVQRVTKYTAPLSWRNGRWHHVVPYSFDLPTDELDERVEKLVGRLELAVPEGDVAVVLAVFPGEGPRRDRAERHADAVKRQLGEKRVEWIESPVRDHELSLEPLERRILRDIADEDAPTGAVVTRSR